MAFFLLEYKHMHKDMFPNYSNSVQLLYRIFQMPYHRNLVLSNT